MNIVFINQKGGVGKSTVALLVASVLKAANMSVAVEDLDPQGSLTLWATEGGGKVPLVHQHPKADYVITDTPGHLDLKKKESRDHAVRIIKKADRIILVTGLHLFSTTATMPMVELVKKYKKSSAKAAVLFNRIKLRTADSKLDRKALAKIFGVPSLENYLPECHAYHTAGQLGWKHVTGRARSRAIDLAMEIVE